MKRGQFLHLPIPTLIFVFLASFALADEGTGTPNTYSVTDPLYAIIAAEIRRTEAELWPIAKPIPADVISRLPPDLQAAARGARYIEVSRISGLPVPYLVIGKGARAAIVVGKVVVFKTVPGSHSNRDMYLWTHEAFHLNQYAELGIDQFIRNYLEGQFGVKAEGAKSGNIMETDADRAACRAFWVAKPGYLIRCP